MRSFILAQTHDVCATRFVNGSVDPYVKRSNRINRRGYVDKTVNSAPVLITTSVKVVNWLSVRSSKPLVLLVRRNIIPKNMPAIPNFPQDSSRTCGKPSRLQRTLFDDVSEIGDLVINGPAFLHEIRNLLVRVHNGGVVTTEKLSNLWQRHRRQLAA